MTFSNLVMQNVTGPISIGLGPRGRRRNPATAAAPNTTTNTPPEVTEEHDSRPPGIVRNISFNNIQATVVVPVGNQYGWRLGRIVDPFGHHWEIGKPLSNAG